MSVSGIARATPGIPRVKSCDPDFSHAGKTETGPYFAAGSRPDSGYGRIPGLRSAQEKDAARTGALFPPMPIPDARMTGSLNPDLEIPPAVRSRCGRDRGRAVRPHGQTSPG